MSIKEAIKRYLFLVIGLFVMAVGVSLSTRSNLGTSPISSIPYVLSLGFPMTIGQITFLMNLVFIAFQIVLLRKQYKLIQLLQIIVAVIFGYFTDLTMGLLSWIHVTSYPAQVGLLLLSCVVLALGVSIEVTADVVLMAGEGVVSAISIVTKKNFGKLKVCFDATLVIVSVIFSFVIFHKLNGVREGTVIAALLVGTIVRFINKRLAFMGKVFKGGAVEVEDSTDMVTNVAENTKPHIIVTISREYGSGGHEIGQRIAKDLGISFYDTQLIQEAAKETGYSEEFIEENNQVIHNLILNRIYSHGYAFSKKDKDPLDAIYEVDRKVILGLANTKSCVIMEHCSDDILANFPNAFHIFIHADEISRMERIQYEYQVPKNNAKETLRKYDRAREAYYHIYTERRWGFIKNYDLTVNSAEFGIEKTVELIENAIRAKYEMKDII